MTNPSVAQVQGIESPQAAPSGLSGSIRALAVAVDFSDKVHTVTATYFDTLIFEAPKAGRGSVRDYYNEVSYGQIDIVTVNLPSSVGWKRAPSTYAYYVNNNYCVGAYPNNCQKLAEDIVDAINGVVNFADYDNDHDGTMEPIMLIHAGRGAEFTGRKTDVWSHSWGLHSSRSYDGVIIRDYVIMPEYWQTVSAASSDMTIGVFAHEMGHGFWDLPDLYDRDDVPDTSEGIGEWSLMASGSWNGPSGLGSSPAWPDAWCRIQMGIVTPAAITANVANRTIPRALDNPSPAETVLKLDSAALGSQEYFLLENRQQTPGSYDQYLPGNGLLIWHVDEAMNVSSKQNDYECTLDPHCNCDDAYHYLVALEQADGLQQMERDINRGDAGDSFPGSSNNRSWTASSHPESSSWYTCGDTCIGVTNIGNSASTMTADLQVACAPLPTTWLGYSPSWNTASNWSSGSVPTCETEVTIPADPGGGQDPTVDAGAEVGNLTVEAGAQVNMNGYTLGICGDLNVQGTFDATGGAVVFKGSSPQTMQMAGGQLPDLQIGTGSAAQTVTALGDLVIDGDLAILSGSSFEGGTGSISLSGNWTLSGGTFVPGSSTVILEGAAVPAVLAAEDGDLVFHNLTVSSTSSATLGDDVAVQNDLIIEAGSIMDLAAYDVSVDGTVTNDGALRQTQSAPNGTTTEFLHVQNAAGTADKYYGLDLHPTSGDMGSTTVTVYGNQFCPDGEMGVRRCFEIDPGTNRTADITLYYRDAEESGQDAARAWHWNGSSWDLLPFGGRDRSSVEGNWVKATGVTSYSPFGLADYSPQPTSVTIAYLQAQPEQDAIRIDWETAQEINILGFNLQRSGSADGLYVQINGSLIPSQAPGGEAGAVYTWTDTLAPPDGTSYYKLQVVDVLGSDTLYGPVSATLTTLNRPPVAVGDQYTTTRNSSLLVLAPGVLLNDHDEDGDDLAATLDTAPQHGDVDLQPDGSLIYTPTVGFSGLDAFTYAASDGALTATATVSLTISLPNDPPLAMDDVYTTTEDTPLHVPTATGVLNNDLDLDGDLLTAVLDSPPLTGSLSLDADGSFIYTPTANYGGLTAFTYHAHDGKASSNTATVTLTIRPVNDPPVAADDAYTAAEGQRLAISAPGVLGNDHDADGDVLTATVDIDVLTGTLALHPNGGFVYTPSLGFNGLVTFTYRASEPKALSNAATVAIVVAPDDEPPLAVPDAYTTSEDVALSVPVGTGVLSNDIDPGGEPLTATITRLPLSGSLSLSLDGSFVYTPTANYFGRVSFTYQAHEGAATSSAATVTVTITPVNDPPLAADDAYSTGADSALAIAPPGVLDNDLDADGDLLTAALDIGPPNGTLSLTPQGGFVYTPTAGYAGIVTFTYHASDLLTDSNPATVTITVGPMRHAVYLPLVRR